MANTHTATFYVQLEPEFSRGWSNEDPRVLKTRAVGLTQKRPTKPKSGTVTVKLSVEVPDAAFLPLRPEAVIRIPTDMTDATPVEVTAEDPSS